VLAAGVTVGAVATSVQAVSMLKEIVVAGRFGPGDQLDAFLIAYLLPAFAINVLGGSLNSALIPAFISVREREGSRAAHDVLAGVMSRTLAMLIGTSAAFALLFPVLLPVLASSFAPAKLALTQSLFYLLLPALILSAVAVLWSGVLNAYDEYALAAAAPALVPIITMIALWLLRGLGVHALAWGLVIGSLLQCVLLGAALRARGVPLRPRWGAASPPVTDVFRQYAPAMFGAVLVSSTALVDQSMSATLGSGSVATFNYGSKLVSALLGIGTLAIGTAVLPHFARLGARGEWAQLKFSLRRYTLILIGVLVPITLVLIVASRPLIRVVFERGAFDAADTARVALVQQLFALQIPFYLVSILIVRVISALRRNQILFWGAVGNVIVNISFNLLFIPTLGVAGVALSTTLVYVAACLGLGAALWREIAKLSASQQQSS